ncbi:MAG: hypothetical protein NVSMB19_23160 [Vulcanimicrobiaceae bacterium]
MSTPGTGSFDAAMTKREALTPASGANLCELDDFEFPPDNLTFLEHFRDMAGAEMAAASPRFAGRKLIIFPAPE